ncbi:hypothetical protein M434DRAFT_11978 [Hypoxylon sp. CO27-5]|nr:hypothetical protein M434DRAFT_11978 [Hypoxylon sp. CO27-5]
MSGKVDDAPPAYGAPPQQPQAAYQGGYPPQGPYGHDPNAQNYQANPNMGYYQQGPPPQGQYPGGPYPPQQGYYPPQQGYPQGQYQGQQQQSGSGAEGCLGVLLGVGGRRKRRKGSEGSRNACEYDGEEEKGYSHPERMTTRREEDMRGGNIILYD